MAFIVLPAEYAGPGPPAVSHHLYLHPSALQVHRCPLHAICHSCDTNLIWCLITKVRVRYSEQFVHVRSPPARVQPEHQLPEFCPGNKLSTLWQAPFTKLF